jgi:hypothetical protein
LERSISTLARYFARQMAAGTVRPMPAILALQTFIGPIFFHVITRPLVEEVGDLRIEPLEAADELTRAILDGLLVREAARP